MKEKLLKKIILTLLYCIGLLSPIFSQDTLEFKSGELLAVKVTAIDIATITYNKFENLTGPVYVIEKNKIASITFQNGTKEYFSETIVPPTTNSNTSKPQETPQMLVYKKGGIVTSNNIIISKDSCRTLFARNPEVLSLYNKGIRRISIGNIISYGDLGYIFYVNIKTIQTGLAASPTTLIIGLSGLTAGIIFTVNGRHRIKEAITLYNSNSIKQ